MTTYHVCAGTGYFADDVKTTCVMDDCGAAIVHRPDASAGALKICARCAASLFKRGLVQDVRISEQTVAEFLLYKRATKGVQ